MEVLVINIYFLVENNIKSVFNKSVKVVPEEKIIYVKNSCDEKKKIKLSKKLLRVLAKKNIKNIVVSNQLKKTLEIKEKDVKIFEGKWLVKYLVQDIINYILNKQNKLIENTNIAVLANNISDDVLQNINFLSSTCKNITIVTKSAEKVKKVQEQLFTNSGVMLIFANNKKKTLLKKDIIINFDFSEEEINNYNIQDDATIINLRGNIKIHKKRFYGLNINDYEIRTIDYKKIYLKYISDDKIVNGNLEKLNYFLSKKELFNFKEIYEALLFRKDNYSNIRKHIEEDNILIDRLIGINGKLL